MHVLYICILTSSVLSCRETNSENQRKLEPLYIKKPKNAFKIFLSDHKQNDDPELRSKSSGAVNVVLAGRVSVLHV